MPACAADERLTSTPDSLSEAMMARAIGCDDSRSRAAANDSSCDGVSVQPGRTCTAVTTGWPYVRVPVLSKITLFTFEAASRISPPRMSRPLRFTKEVAQGTAACVNTPQGLPVPLVSVSLLATYEQTRHAGSETHLRAPCEVPTSTAVGAASPSAQGQATTRTLQASCAASSRAAPEPLTAVQQ